MQYSYAYTSTSPRRRGSRLIYFSFALFCVTIFFYLRYINNASSFGGFLFSEKEPEESGDISSQTSSSSTTILKTVATTTSTTVLTTISTTISSESTHTALLPSSIPTVEMAPFWLEGIKHQGKAAYNQDPMQYKVFRNVKDFGAKGDGVTDDTYAINQAISSQSRCGEGCDSSTTSPALVYFPSGTYLISSPIIAMYYTQLVGNPNDPPTLKATPGFTGIAVIDSDPYLPGGANWYQNQNNFFRAVRNFVIDVRQMPPNVGTGIHWQVAQATSLHNIRFEMRTDAGNRQQGIFMDNGSGGFLSNLVFNGGKFGAFFGNQQFTTLNLTFNNCETAIFMNWNWIWLLKNIHITNCKVGLDISNGGPDNLAVGSVILMDSTIRYTPKGVITAKSIYSNPPAGATFVMDNVKIHAVDVAVTNLQDMTILEGSKKTKVIDMWGQGLGYTHVLENGGEFNWLIQRLRMEKPKRLLDQNGHFVERSRPQYEALSADRFISVKDEGAVGDGKADDTAALRKIFEKYSNQPSDDTRKIIFFDHGHYVVTDTIVVPPNTYIVGEVWSTIVSAGKNFADCNNPRPVFKFGNLGDVGHLEISDMLFQSRGPAGGAIMMEWNIRAPEDNLAAVAMWDTHVRIGGSAGTNLQSGKFTKKPDEVNNPSESDIDSQSAFLLVHITKNASLYMENAWIWTADHELDNSDHDQITIYSGRGLLCEADQGPVWLYGSAVEHNVLYQYQFVNAKNVFMGAIQTETPYYQNNPSALKPYKFNSTWFDPDIAAECVGSEQQCTKAWGMRAVNSSDIYVYGAGLYSFFENYSTDCIKTNTCQKSMVLLEGGQKIWIFGLNTIGTEVMTVFRPDYDDEESWKEVKAFPNKNGFTDTAAVIVKI